MIAFWITFAKIIGTIVLVGILLFLFCFIKFLYEAVIEEVKDTKTSISIFYPDINSNVDLFKCLFSKKERNKLEYPDKCAMEELSNTVYVCSLGIFFSVIAFIVLVGCIVIIVTL